MSDNNRRYDLSDRLIHFFRKLDLDDGSAPHVPETWGDHNISEHTVYSALFLLRSAIRHGRLWATWALRKNVRTVYGPWPAVCLTDMPTAAFIETSVSRARAGQKISTYALTFPKKQMFALGARPAIYGLSGSTAGIPDGKGGGSRLIPPEILPPQEQYRYVSYYPTGRWQVDWTHERECRWPYTGCLNEFDAQIAQYGVVSEVRDIPGLDLYMGDLEGIGVIVNSKDEADMIVHDVLSLVDRRVIAPSTFEYVLVAGVIPSPAAIRDPDEEEKAIAAATIDLSLYLTPDTSRDEDLVGRVHALIDKVEGEANPSELGEPGGCWLWLVDNTHPVTRALVNADEIVVSRDGKYLLPLYGFSDDRSLRQREDMTKKLAGLVGKAFGVAAGYFSVLMSDDPNGVPSYNSDFLGNPLHYNFWHHGLE